MMSRYGSSPCSISPAGTTPCASSNGEADCEYACDGNQELLLDREKVGDVDESEEDGERCWNQNDVAAREVRISDEIAGDDAHHRHGQRPAHVLIDEREPERGEH